MQRSQDPFEQDLTISIKPRNFKCPCGKSYLSYAALFTHIKQKHDGKAPGKILKPPSLYQKRGRPPIKPKQERKEIQKGVDTDIPLNSSEPLFPSQTEEQKAKRMCNAVQAIQQLASLLETMPVQELCKQHLNEMQVFSQMNVYLNTRTTSSNFVKGNICLADGFIEFAQDICSHLPWVKFQPLYMLFMLFLQYIVDEQNSIKILCESNMDIYCEYINEFIENHMKEMAQNYDIDRLWIFQKDNSISVFFHFFNWCTNKHYITYRINLTNQSPKKNSSQKDMGNATLKNM